MVYRYIFIIYIYECIYIYVEFNKWGISYFRINYRIIKYNFKVKFCIENCNIFLKKKENYNFFFKGEKWVIFRVNIYSFCVFYYLG